MFTQTSNNANNAAYQYQGTRRGAETPDTDASPPPKQSGYNIEIWF